MAKVECRRISFLEL